MARLPPREATMSQLEHLFAAGVRFDTEVQYRALGAGGIQYQRLPIRRSTSASECAVLSVLQCVAVLGQIPRNRLMGRLRHATRSDQGDHDTPVEEDALLRYLRPFAPSLTAKVLISSDASRIGTAALHAIRSGRMALVRFESPTASRWATVIGVELERKGSGGNPVRALLLLDSSASEPWACAHNARLELGGIASPSVHARAGFPLNCRCLTGEACAVRLHSLITLRRAPCVSC